MILFGYESLDDDEISSSDFEDNFEIINGKVKVGCQGYWFETFKEAKEDWILKMQNLLHIEMTRYENFQEITAEKVSELSEDEVYAWYSR